MKKNMNLEKSQKHKMKTFSEYINESRQNYIFGGTDDRNTDVVYNYVPKDKNELKNLMRKLREERGEDGDFNDIDTSKITNMSEIFYYEKHFNGDISLWDTSNVTMMQYMLAGAHSFNQDISQWDTSNVTDMYKMFYQAKSFNQDISSWDTSSVAYNEYMFDECPIKEEYKPKFNI